ncbi:hypothetical protein JCM1841_000439 [Sporobolomyces salmonicolor]
MAPPTPGRYRGPRPQVNNNIGEAGRTTNIAPPKQVPRDSAGHERPSDFFARAGRDDNEDDEYEEEEEEERFVSKHVKQSARKKAVNGGSEARRGERPDRYMLGEDRGRKTGVQKAVAYRDEDGFEAVDNFFLSPSPARTAATAKSTIKTQQRTKNHQKLFQREYEEDEQDESDMMVDDGTTSLSPLTYQRAHASSAARKPSTLRQSTLPSGSHSISRRGLGSSNSSPGLDGASKPPRRRLSSLSGDGEGGNDEPMLEDLNLASSDEEDEEAEEEEVRRVVGAKSGPRKSTVGEGRPKALVNGKAKGKRKAVVPSDDDDMEEQREDDEEEEAPSTSQWTTNKKATRRDSTSTRRSSAGSPGGLVKLGKHGQLIAVSGASNNKVKGKGKEVVRSPSPVYDQQDDFGGGEGYDEEAEQFQFGDYGDEDDQEEEDDQQPKASTSKGKGKARASNASSMSARESPAAKTAASKAKKTAAAPKQVVTQIKKRGRDEASVDLDGVRRSTRQRLEPLEYWRNERVIYKRRSSGVGMSAVVRVPKVEPVPLAARKAASKKRSASQRAGTVKYEPPEEEGCDDMTDPDGLVWSWEGNAETTRRIAFTAKMIDPKATYNNQYQFQKIYQELDYLAGGVLVIPPGGQKSTKPAKDNSYIFFCIEGSVSVIVHRTRFAIGPGGTFFVPRGNSYSIEATSNRDVKLFFAQGRRVLEYPDGSTRNDTVEDSQRFLAEEEQLEPVPEEDEEQEEGEDAEE